MADEHNDLIPGEDEAPGRGEEAGAGQGFHFQELSGSQFADEPDEAEVIEASDAEATKPKAHGKVIEEAELLSSDDPVVEQRPQQAPRSFNRRHAVPLAILAVIIIALFWGLSQLGGSSVTSEGTDEPDVTEPASNDDNNNGAPEKKSGKGSKPAKPDAGSERPRVILIPPQGKKRGADKGNDTKKGGGKQGGRAPRGGLLPDKPNEDLVNSKADPKIEAALRVLRAKNYPSSYRSRPGKLAAYISEQIDYPVVTNLTPGRSGVVGLAVLDPLGEVMLTHLPRGEKVPELERAKIWPRRDI